MGSLGRSIRITRWMWGLISSGAVCLRNIRVFLTLARGRAAVAKLYVQFHNYYIFLDLYSPTCPHYQLL